MTLPRLVCIATFCCVLLPPARAVAVKDREGAVRGDKAKMAGDARWIYNDVDRGFAEAKRTGQPLLVVLRCVPCLSCVGLDAQVLTEPGLAPLLDRFVCVRLINANAIDLARFQFDYDLSFSTLLFNGDGTLYGRYGSWTHQTDPEARETIGYRRALEAALELHRGYPANRAALAKKQGGPTPFRTPVEIPGLAERYGRELNWGGRGGEELRALPPGGRGLPGVLSRPGGEGPPRAHLPDAGGGNDRAQPCARSGGACDGGRGGVGRGAGGIAGGR